MSEQVKIIHATPLFRDFKNNSLFILTNMIVH